MRTNLGGCKPRTLDTTYTKVGRRTSVELGLECSIVTSSIHYAITKLIIKIHYWYIFINSHKICVSGTSKESFTVV